MFPRRLLLSVSLLCVIAGGRSDPQYVLTIPALLKSGETEKACVNLLGHKDRLDLNVRLEYNGVNTTIFSENVPAENYFQCNNFTVPTVEKTVPVFVTLSAVGGSVELLERKAVVIDTMENVYLIQMDKPIYKAGQKVQFRLISLNSQLRPVKEKYTVVHLRDPSGSRVSQWLNQDADSGIAQMEFQLINDAALGSYYITAERASGFSVTQWFSVEEYVLPRFSVTMDSTRTLSVLDEILTFNVSAMYTYGQPVPGSITGRWCRRQSFNYGRRQNCIKNKDGICSNITGKLGLDGTFQGIVDLSQFQLQLSGLEMSLNLDITVTEEGTGIQVTESRYVRVTSQLARVSFDYNSLNQYYKRGIPYLVKVTLADEGGHPLADEIIELGVNEEIIQNLTTDADGKAEYGIDTSNYVETNMNITASYKNTEQCYYTTWESPGYPIAKYTATRFYSQTGSFLQVQQPQGELSCGQSQSIEVQYALSKAGVGEEASKVIFYYLVMSRTAIVRSGQQEVDVTNSLRGSFSFNITICSDLAPSADFIVYSILQTEVIADTVGLDIEKCFKNQVSLSFSEERGTPASNVDLQLTAAPGSLCGIRVIDYSLLLLNPYEQFTANSVYYSLRHLSLYGYNVGGFDVEEPAPSCVKPGKQIFYNGSYYVPVSSKDEGDTYNKIKSVGLVFGTGATLRKPQVCQQKVNEKTQSAIQHGLGGGFGGGGSGESSPLAFSVAERKLQSADVSSGSNTITTVRKNFPETWVWKTESVNSKGHGTIPEVVPGTITQWQGSMFCVSEEEGFGMARYPANFTAFQSFFVELSLPYSVTRGEILVIKAFVSNYLEQHIKVHGTLKSSNDFEAVSQEGEQDACVLPGQRASYSWNIDAKSLGEISFEMSAETTHIGESCDGPNDPSQQPRKDTVIQSLIVEAEGIRKEVTSSNLICVQDINSETLISITPPENVVPDSAEAFVTTLGDILGLPLQNMQGLIQLPFGCGEQNLVRMAPIPHVLQYLNSTGQLTDEILSKAKDFLNTGYYRQLKFMLSSGAYDTFGGWEAKGNSWLTCYVFKTFEEAKKLIYIDEKIQQQTLIWLENSQKLESGCFKPVGDLFNSALKGGADDDLSFTAFLAIALLESKYSLGMSLLDGCLECLVTASKSEQSIYNRALMVYAFTLAGDWERRGNMLDTLKTEAVSEGGTLHWERADKPDREFFPFFNSPYAPAEVEITSYMMLSIAKGPNVTNGDLSYMAQIAVWMIQQQNSYGGFQSTQDTVVALQALSAYAHLIFTPNTHHNVRVSTGNGDILQFTLNQDNRLVVQRQSLPNVPGDYQLNVNGIGCCLVQTTVRYNIPVPKANSAFSLSVNTSSESCVNGVAYTFTIGIQVSYRGSRNQSNMAIIDIKLLSGYQTDYMSLRELENSKLVSKSEEKNNHVYLYLNSVSSKTIYLPFKVQIGSRVLNIKNALVYVYDYYETADNGATAYSHPCSAAEQ
ncbi:ovostatin-like isoform X1 [Ascaphus truei]|uniref:ovostatin-like isoform X1 n=1 Tax=Ascaphus truei TaxID=8439 RepID=UPI003F5AD601